MKIYIEKDDKHIEETFKGKVSELLRKIGVNPETVIVVRNNELITEEDSVKNSDTIKLISVISGG